MAHVTKILAAVGMTAAAALAPVSASAQSYDYFDCKRSDKDAQVVGGLLGAALGAVAGHEIAGRGETTEGAVIGGIAGAVAGAAIGDDRRNCTKETYGTTGYSQGSVYTVPTTTTYGGTVYEAHHPTRRNRHYRHNRGYDRGYNRGHDRGYRDYGYGQYRTSWQVRQEIERLKAEDRRLKHRERYDRRPWIDRRRDEIRYEVKRLKRIEDQLERREDRWEDRRDRRDRRWYGDNRYDNRHYHGSTVCYADH